MEKRGHGLVKVGAKSYIEHCRTIVSEWEKIVGEEGENSLRTVWVMGALTTALEAGIISP
jgi:hypothetical protein